MDYWLHNSGKIKGQLVADEGGWKNRRIPGMVGPYQKLGIEWSKLEGWMIAYQIHHILPFSERPRTPSADGAGNENPNRGEG